MLKNTTKEERVTKGAMFGIVFIIVQLICFIFFKFTVNLMIFYLELVISNFLIGNYSIYISKDELKRYMDSAREINTFIENHIKTNEETGLKEVIVLNDDDLKYAPEIIMVREDTALRRLGLVFLIINTILQIICIYVWFNPSNTIQYISTGMIAILFVFNLFNYIAIYIAISHNRKHYYTDIAYPFAAMKMSISLKAFGELFYKEQENNDINEIKEDKNDE